MKQNELLKNSLPLIAAGLGDKLGVRVTVSGTQAWTDNHVINIPDFNISSKEEKNAVLGLMSHEAAHIKFNTFNGIDTNQFKNALHHCMWNIFEDLRIEKAMIDTMVGTEKWINQIWINRQQSGTRQPVTSQSQPVSIITDLLLFHCRVKYRKQVHLQPYLDAAEEAFIDVLGWKLLMQVQSCIDAMLGSLASSVDAFNLATHVESLIANHQPEEEEQEPEKDEPDSQEDSSDSESESDSDGEQSSSETPENSTDDDDSSSESNSDSGSGESEEEEGEGQGNNGSEQDDSEGEQGESSNSNSGPSGSESEEGNSQSPGQQNESQEITSGNASTPRNGQPGQEPDAKQVLAAIAAALGADEEDITDDMAQFVSQLETLANANTEPSKVGIPGSVEAKSKKGSGDALNKTVKQTSNSLTAKLSGLVQENMRVRAKTATSGNRLNSKVLYRAKTGDARLFKTKTVKKEIDTIVEIQIDNSGSMVDRHKDLLKVAKEAQLALAMALSRIHGVSVTASAFPTYGDEFDVFELLSEGESVKKLSDRLHALQAQGWNTPSASAMWHSIKKVIQSNKNRKVILFITDGYPNYEQREELTRLVNRAERNGIVVVGIAIGDIANEQHEFRKYFNNALFIHNIAELKKEIFKVAQDILIG
jgi:hypothetical protein